MRLNRQGVTILLVEQNVAQTLRAASRGYVLENGRIVLAGASESPGGPVGAGGLSRPLTEGEFS